jgi:hypothetical protein
MPAAKLILVVQNSFDAIAQVNNIEIRAGRRYRPRQSRRNPTRKIAGVAKCRTGRVVEHQQSMSPMLQQATLVCLPWHGGEGVPKALIEAAASARLSPPMCRVQRYCPATNGLLEPLRNPAALADAIARY